MEAESILKLDSKSKKTYLETVKTRIAYLERQLRSALSSSNEKKINEEISILKEKQ